jgi:hypothetical protein
MEALYEGIFIKENLKLHQGEIIKRSLSFGQKTKAYSLAFVYAFILFEASMAIQYFLGVPYIFSFMTIVIVYPFIRICYCLNKSSLNCKYMP